MNWTRFFLAVVLSGLATSITDWLFMGVLFHNKYLATPEIWRLKAGQSETRGIVLSSLLGVSSCAAFLYFYIWSGTPFVYPATLQIAFLFWVAAPVRIRSWAFRTRLVGWRVLSSPASSAPGCFANENYKQTKSPPALQSRLRIHPLWRNE